MVGYQELTICFMNYLNSNPRGLFSTKARFQLKTVGFKRQFIISRVYRLAELKTRSANKFSYHFESI